MSRFIQVEDSFHEGAEAMRGVFDERFANPRETGEHRFVWDWWHVPQQYTFLRTPAWEYFPAEVWEPFHAALQQFGRTQLGCADVSPPWLSVYVDGCEQNLHSDVPHGPWAWVYSLTPPERTFKGAETLILKPETLDYWTAFSDQEDRETGGLLDTIAPDFNRLVVFDPRLPHGVTRLSGTQDPREGRLVIHGWFTEPQPFVEGELTRDEVDAALDGQFEVVAPQLADLGHFHGLLSLALSVNAEGRVESVVPLANTLVDLDAPSESVEEVTALLADTVAEQSFPAKSGPSRITLPLLLR